MPVFPALRWIYSSAYLTPLPLYGSGGLLALILAATWPTNSFSIPSIWIVVFFSTVKVIPGISSMITGWENPKDISIFDSINKTDKIVSRFSTVLFQAYSMNKKIVIDNVSDIEQYNKLKEVGYIMIEKEHELLSDIL